MAETIVTIKLSVTETNDTLRALKEMAEERRLISRGNHPAAEGLNPQQRNEAMKESARLLEIVRKIES